MITIKMPANMVPGERRQWLERHVPDVDPGRPGERERVQGIVDSWLRRGRVVSLNHAEAFQVPAGQKTSHTWAQEHGFTVEDLAAAVADNIADRIGQQRAAIRAMAPEDRRSMIAEIFRDLADGNYVEHEIASKYGLTRPTFSRFAGGRWLLKRDGARTHVPDLWKATARTILRCPTLREAAVEAGVPAGLLDLLGGADGRGDRKIS